MTENESLVQVDGETQETEQTTLLFVDDEENILKALRRLFRREGYRVLMAPGGREGLQVMRAESVDLVISDMRMPEMSGAEFLAEVADRWPQVVRMLLTGYADLSSTIDAINKGQIYGYFSKPWEENDIKLAVRRALEQQRLKADRQRLAELTERQNAELKDLNATLEARVAARTRELEQANDFLDLTYQELRESYFSAIPLFANVVEMREGLEAGKSGEVGEMARDVAKLLGMDEDDARQTYFAALLRNIGKVGLPDELVHMPVARMTEMQREALRKHPVVGQGILMSLEPLQTAAGCIRHQNEHFDGAGYPDGLKGEAIPLGARILAVVGDYHGLRSGALLGEQLSLPNAREILEKHRGKRYDPQVLDAFLEILRGRAEEGGRRELFLASSELGYGMVLSRELSNKAGVLLLNKGRKLTKSIIDKLRAYEKDAETPFVVHVWADPDEEQPEP